MASEIAPFLVAEPATVPLSFSIALFIILLLLMICISTVLLWQAMCIFRKRDFGLKKSFLASLFSNVAQSAVFGVVFALLAAKAGPVAFSSRLLVSAVAIVEVVAVLAINLFAVKKACRLPVREIINPVVLWTLFLMFISWFAMPLIGSFVGAALLKAYPFPG